MKLWYALPFFILSSATAPAEELAQPYSNIVSELTEQHFLSTRERIHVIVRSNLKSFDEEFNSLKAPDILSYRAFAVLAVDPTRGTTEIRFLESLPVQLGPDEARALIEEFVNPYVRNPQVLSIAVTRAVYETLRTLESPLLASGLAEKILEANGLNTQSLKLTPQEKSSGGTAFAVLLGFLALGLSLLHLLQVDVHYSAQGVIQARTFFKFKRRRAFSGGAVHGNF